MQVFTEVDTLNQRCITLEQQHKHRELQEQHNLEKVAEFANRFQFMSRMIQKIDADHEALKKEHASLKRKFNEARQLVVHLK